MSAAGSGLRLRPQPPSHADRKQAHRDDRHAKALAHELVVPDDLFRPPGGVGRPVIDGAGESADQAEQKEGAKRTMGREDLGLERGEATEKSGEPS